MYKPSIYYRRFVEVSDIWEKALERYSDQQLAAVAPSQTWSMGQVYMHLFEGTQQFQLKKMEEALDPEAPVAGKKKLVGSIMFFFDSFPPMRIKVPASSEYTPRAPGNKEEIFRTIERLKQLVYQSAEKLHQIESFTGKAFHPAFGWLTALEWFALIPMHIRHHLRQKRRIDRELGGK